MLISKTGILWVVERVVSDKFIGTHVDNENSKETRIKAAVIVYSKTGSHIYPRKVE